MPVHGRALAVVAGVLRDASGRLLLAQRSGGSDSGRWEFAGGKIRVGESAQAALLRELHEELGITLRSARPLTLVRWRGAPRSINLHSFYVDAWLGTPRAIEHLDLAWVAPSALIHYSMPAPDRPIRARLALPAQYLITPESEVSTATFLQQFARAIENPQLGMVSLRAKSLAPAALAERADRVLAVARTQRPDLLVLIHGAIELVQSCGFDGVHLSAQQLHELPCRPLPESLWVLASCHSRTELQAAEALAVDAVSLSPWKRTVSHPTTPALGPRGAQGLMRRSYLPAYALGGVLPADQPALCAAGWQGIAAIRGLWPKR